jgi:hypothetical protein
MMIPILKFEYRSSVSRSYMTICPIVKTDSYLILEVKQTQAMSVVGSVTSIQTWFNLPLTKMPHVHSPQYKCVDDLGSQHDVYFCQTCFNKRSYAGYLNLRHFILGSVHICREQTPKPTDAANI